MTFVSQLTRFRECVAVSKQQLSDRTGVSVSYTSKVENERLHFGDCPSEKFIHKLAENYKPMKASC